MSGMVGLVSRVCKSDPGRMSEALLAIKHRGPDGSEIVSGNWGSLGANILRADNGAERTIIAKGEDGVFIALDGSVLNYKDIMSEPRADGFQIDGSCPRTMTLGAYRKYGIGFLNKILGEVSIVVLDTRKGRLFLIRSFLGVRPLYYMYRDQALWFASEIKAILKLNPAESRADQSAIVDYLTFQYNLDGKTLFSDIKKLEPGCYLEWEYMSDKVPKVINYWKPAFEADFGHDEGYFVERTKELIHESVLLNLQYDGPIGCYLSGGLDSSTVASFVARTKPDMVLHTFCGKYLESGNYDESEYAKCVVNAIGSNHKEIIPRADEFTELIRKITYLMDEPQGGPGLYGQYVVGREAARQVKMALSGEGGDELFLGYAKYLIAYLEECLRGSIFETTNQQKYVATLQSIAGSLPLLKTYVGSLQSFWSDGLLNSKDVRYFDLCNRLRGTEGIISPDVFKIEYDPKEVFLNCLSAETCQSHINMMSRFDTFVGLQAVLQVDDRTSMGHGIENRVPLMDRRLVELIASVPPKVKFSDGKQKYLLRKAIQGIVPDKIVSRKDKMGFPIPINHWFSSSLKDFVRDILLSKKSKERGIFTTQGLEKLLEPQHAYSRVLWGALNLELWFQTFID